MVLRTVAITCGPWPVRTAERVLVERKIPKLGVRRLD